MTKLQHISKTENQIEIKKFWLQNWYFWTKSRTNQV